MIRWIERLFRPKSDVMDDLLELADGDVDLLRAAIRRAADGSGSADLEDVVAAIMEARRAGRLQASS